MSEYTAISFAPVQGFIEKSRKLRDLYGASLILSFLSYKLVQKAKSESLGLKVISPGLPDHQEGMPNRILIKGKFERNDVQNTLLEEWRKILLICRVWIEDNLDIPKDQYYWSQTEDQKDKQKGEWERWGSYTWEIFWGYGESETEAIKKAMDDLETRKLKRDWTAINWMGESSSLTGTDAIAWHQLGKESKEPGRSLTKQEQEQQELFYRRLSWLLDNPDYRVGKPSLSLEQLREYEKSKPDDIGKYIAVNERLSIPELVKRLVTYDKIADAIGMEKLKKKPEDPEFKDINREAGYWTGWFMGDGDEVGKKLKKLATRPGNNEEKREQELKCFTDLIRGWGKDFYEKEDLFPEGKGRVIYAGGDDFLGVLYSEESKTQEKPEKVKPIEALNWLLTLEGQWKDLQNTIKQELDLDFTYSVGFVWAGHQVPQRDILQHCRDAEKRAKSLGRDRITIRVVFNSGKFVQWTCPWTRLNILTEYRDRNGKTWGENPNWTHIYNDWAELKARHAIRLKAMEGININKQIALELFNLYFNDIGKVFSQQRLWDEIAGNNTEEAIVNWIDDLVQVGWQLCRNSNV
ncbi:MAG: CRISPR-associated protein Cmr2 [Microcoleus sp. SU_5_6]|nr:CRISPR-associated protein Cmr2 [Microcoleus sp. SU_5_6]